jgi:hypothetical protein
VVRSILLNNDKDPWRQADMYVVEILSGWSQAGAIGPAESFDQDYEAYKCKTSFPQLDGLPQIRALNLASDSLALLR